MKKEIINQMPDYAKEWCEKRLNTLGYLPEDGEVEFVRDYLHALPGEDERMASKIYKMRWDDVFDKSLIWHDRMEAKRLKVLRFDGEANDINQEIHFNNGFKFVRITSTSGLDYEGNAMGHCVGYGYYDDLKRVAIYSLRDADNLPHITIEENLRSKAIVQIQGRGNDVIHKKYIPMIKKFIVHKNPSSVCSFSNDDNFIIGCETGQKENRIYDIEDFDNLPDTIRNREITYRFFKEDSKAVLIKEVGTNWSIVSFSDTEAFNILKNKIKKYKIKSFEKIEKYNLLFDTEKKDLFNLSDINLPKSIKIGKDTVIFPIIINQINYGFLKYIKGRQYFYNDKLIINSSFTQESVNYLNKILSNNAAYKKASISIENEQKNKNYYFGVENPKNNLQIFHVSNLPKYVFSDCIVVKNQDNDIKFPRKIHLMALERSKNKFIKEYKTPGSCSITIEQNSGNIVLPEKILNTNISCYLNNNSGEIVFGDYEYDFKLLDMRNSFNFNKMPTIMHEAKIIFPNGDVTNNSLLKTNSSMKI